MNRHVRQFVDRILEADDTAGAPPAANGGVPGGDAPESVQDAIIGDFKNAYMEAALATSHDIDDDDPGGGDPLDRNFSTSDIAAETMEKMFNDCNKFVAKFGNIIAQKPRQAGIDFWLTRNGHGAGFWDGDWPEDGDTLTAGSKEFGEVDLYVGDDGQIYQTP